MYLSGYPALCGIGAALCLLPLPWHWQARNVTVLIYLGWVSTACLIAMISSIIWAGNVNDVAPVWCDITSRYRVCLNTGITTAGLCIQRHLYRAATRKEAMDERARKKELIINLVLGVGLPALMLPLYYTVQSLRYVVIEDSGCWPAVYPSFMATLMVSMWPVLASAASFIYGALTLYTFFKSRHRFYRNLSESGSGLSTSRFFRLMALAATDMICALPLALYFLVSGVVDQTLYHYSWGDVHEYINEVGVTLRSDIESDREYLIGFGFSNWSIPACAFFFFIFFGLSREAFREYKRILWKAAALLGFKPSAPQPEAQKSNWHGLRPAGVTTTCQGLMAPSPAYTAHSKSEPMGELDEKIAASIRYAPSINDTRDLESGLGDPEKPEKDRDTSKTG